MRALRTNHRARLDLSTRSNERVDVSSCALAHCRLADRRRPRVLHRGSPEHAHRHRAVAVFGHATHLHAGAVTLPVERSIPPPPPREAAAAPGPLAASDLARD